MLDKFENTKFYKDGYRLADTNPLGNGQYGTVYLLEKKDQQLGITTKRCVKHIQQSLPLRKVLPLCGNNQNQAWQILEQQVQNLKREIILLAELSGHNHIVRYLDHEVETTSLINGYTVNLWMLKEYYESVLTDYVSGKRLTLIQVVTIVNQIADALAFMHSQKPPIIHRDIKPDNILLDNRFNLAAKLDDFGQAKMSVTGVSHSRNAGTPMYSALEVDTCVLDYKGELADIFSLGATFFECVTGKPPFIAGILSDLTSPDKVDSIIIQSKREGNIGAFDYLNEDFEKVVTQSTNPDPSKRYQSIVEMKNDLNHLLIGQTYETWAAINIKSFIETRDSFHLDKAIENQKLACELSPNNHKFWSHLGLYYLNKTMETEAKECFEKSLKIKPGYEPAIQNLRENFL